MDVVTDAWTLLAGMPPLGLFGLLWLTLLAEAPRYFIGVQATAAALLLRDGRRYGPLPPLPPVSILLAGHNESDVIAKCVHSLRNQTFNDVEIVCVDDGSSDDTHAIMRALQEQGVVRTVCRLQLRGGKAAALNAAARLARGEIFVVVDCDCSFDNDAIEELLRPLACDPDIGGVSGNILVRNWKRSITASLQGIEYLVSISLGKSFANVLDQVSCASGAYGAFRRSAWTAVGGMDTGGGEDLDFTIRLRMAGWKIVFARHSICYTDVPESTFALLRQRTRWECDGFWIRLRKYRRLFAPLTRPFAWREVAHQWDFVVFTLIPTLIFPVYTGWLLATYGESGVTLLVAVAIALSVMDVVVFVCAVLVTGKPEYWRLALFLPLYGLYQSYVLRLNRFYACVSEAISSLSLKDNYVPKKVRDINGWR
jgi:cellulose synthase/poly-beta-1,6-N-acetylglucosamine synthase-like glycosyltransferase